MATPVTRRSEHTSTVQAQSSTKMEEALEYVKTLSVTGTHRVPDDERGIDALIDEKYSS